MTVAAETLVALAAPDARTASAIDYGRKDGAYFSGARGDIVDALTTGADSAILEVGCGTGATGALALSRGKAGRYVGIELFEAAAAEARQVLSDVIVGDIERIDLRLEPGSFDVLILSEVLEHLVDPWAVLRRLAPLLRHGGRVFASSPNVSHWRVIRKLSAGRFTLADQGVFDRTHMRWFTPSTYRDLFEQAGFVVDRVGPLTPFSTRTRAILRITRGRLDHLFMVQISLAAHRR